jgi:hypothetical protein
MTFRQPLSRFLAVATVAAGLALGAGCDSGSARCAVEGEVTYDGQAVDQGGIVFLPEPDDNTRFRATGFIKDGRYEFDDRKGPNPGKYRVQITWNKKTGRQVKAEGGVMKDETEQVLPAKYNTKSDLLVDVQPGRNNLPFKLAK